MIYRILHRLFGWDYIHWDDGVFSGVSRLHRDGSGNVFFWKYKSIKVLEHINTTRDRVTWLTCPREKWMGDEVAVPKVVTPFPYHAEGVINFALPRDGRP